MNKNYYAVHIKDIFDLYEERSFLEALYLDIFHLYQQKQKLTTYCDQKNEILEAKLSKIEEEIKSELQKYHLPEYLVFEGLAFPNRVRELLSKEELSLSPEVLKVSRVNSIHRLSLGHYLNSYTPEQIIKICDIFPKYCYKKRKTEIVDFSGFKRK